MSAAAGTPRGRLAIALVIALATIAGLTVIGSTPAPAPALPPTDSTTDGTTDGTTGGTTGTPPPQHTLNVRVQGPGQITGDAPCTSSSATPSGSITTCPTLVDEGAEVNLTAAALGSHGQTFSSWSGACGTTSTDCTFTMPNSNTTVTAIFVDNGAPVVAVSSPSANELLVREPGGSVAVTSSSTDPNATRTNCTFDAVPSGPTCSTQPGDTSPTGATSHSVAVTYTDPSGNQGFFTRNFRVYILDTTLSGPTGTVTAQPVFSFDSTKDDSSFTCRIDGGTGFPCTSPYTTELPDGDHTFAVAASHTYETVTRTDSTAATKAFTLDRPDEIGGTPGGGTTPTPVGPLGNSPLSETPTCTVPKLKGKTLRKAKRALTKAGCKLGKVTKKSSAKVARNRVVKSRPAAGRKVPLATKVALVLSRGRR